MNELEPLNLGSARLFLKWAALLRLITLLPSLA
jgi:hypothetical protein